MELREIKDILKATLKPARYSHSKRTALTCQCLAMKYGIDLDKAYMAGILHDNCHNFSSEYQLEQCDKYNISLSSEERAIGGSVIHSKLGAYYAKTKFGIEDEDILNAIKYHTTGRPNMSMLEKILFTADYIEPGRDKAPNLSSIRRLAFEDIDMAIFMICQDTVTYLQESSLQVDSKTLETLEYYK